MRFAAFISWFLIEFNFGNLALAADERWLALSTSAYLGQGFDAIYDQIKPQACLERSEGKVPTAFQSAVYFTKPLGRKQLDAVLSQSGRIPPDVLMQNANLQQLGTLQNTSTDSDVFFYLFVVKSTEQSLGKTQLRPASAQLNDLDFLQNCGSRFISSQTPGGFLLISVIINYSNQEMATRIREDANWEGASLYTFADHLERVTPGFRSALSISINFQQVGGKPEFLLKNLAWLNDGPGFSCRPNAIHLCREKMTSIGTYALKSADGFRAQFDGALSPSMLSFTTSSYQQFGLRTLPGVNPDLSPYRFARESLILELLTSRMDRNRWLELSRMRLHRYDQSILDGLETAIDSNIAWLESAVRGCLEAADSCEKFQSLLNQNLRVYDRAALQHRLDFLDYCLLPNLPLSEAHTLEILLATLAETDCIRAFQALREISELNLARKNITSLIPLLYLDNPNLTILDLSHNKLEDIGALSTFTKVGDINIRYNQITKIDALLARQDLTGLDAAYNRIARVAIFSKPQFLSVLSLLGNPLENPADLAGILPSGSLFIEDAQLCDREIDWVQGQGIVSKGEAEEYRFLRMAPYYSTFPLRSRRILHWISCKVAARELQVLF